MQLGYSFCTLAKQKKFPQSNSKWSCPSQWQNEKYTGIFAKDSEYQKYFRTQKIID